MPRLGIELTTSRLHRPRCPTSLNHSAMETRAHPEGYRDSAIGPASETHLSLEMLQSMTVFLLVLTTMKGSWMAELDAGSPRVASSCWLRCTRFLNAICCKRNNSRIRSTALRRPALRGRGTDAERTRNGHGTDAERERNVTE